MFHRKALYATTNYSTNLSHQLQTYLELCGMYATSYIQKKIFFGAILVIGEHVPLYSVVSIS